MKKKSVRSLTISALLIAMGVIIPMVMPKIMIPPASFTLASHVPIFIAMFFSFFSLLMCLDTFMMSYFNFNNKMCQDTSIRKMLNEPFSCIQLSDTR